MMIARSRGESCREIYSAASRGPTVLACATTMLSTTLLCLRPNVYFSRTLFCFSFNGSSCGHPPQSSVHFAGAAKCRCHSSKGSGKSKIDLTQGPFSEEGEEVVATVKAIERSLPNI